MGTMGEGGTIEGRNNRGDGNNKVTGKGREPIALLKCEKILLYSISQEE